MILTDIRFAISEVLSRTKSKPNPPFLIVLDEFGSYATPDFSVVFEKSREANVIVVEAIQSLSNLTDGHKMLSRDFAERILGNANKIFMSLEALRPLWKLKDMGRGLHENNPTRRRRAILIPVVI